MTTTLSILDQRLIAAIHRGRSAFSRIGRTSALHQMQSLALNWQKPRHAAFILDGNRRYAVRERLATCRMGHEAGNRRAHELIELSHRYGIPNLSVYAFSVENFKRSASEITAILDILGRTMDEMLDPDHIVNRLGVRLCVIGDRSLVPPQIRAAIECAEEHTRQHTAMNLFLSVAYDGRDEIVRAVRRCASRGVSSDSISLAEISQSTDLQAHVQGVPRVDLVVRTGGGKRLSSFLMWDATHAEIYFTEVLWPDFDEYEFLRALSSFASAVQSSQATDFHYWSHRQDAALSAISR